MCKIKLISAEFNRKSKYTDTTEDHNESDYCRMMKYILRVTMLRMIAMDTMTKSIMMTMMNIMSNDRRGNDDDDYRNGGSDVLN